MATQKSKATRSKKTSKASLKSTSSSTPLATSPSQVEGVVETLDKAQKVHSGLPADLQKKVDEHSKELEQFKTKVLDKFGEYIVGMTILPPPLPVPTNQAAKGQAVAPAAEQQATKTKDLIEILVVVDDTTSKKMSKDELHHKFSTIVKDIAKATHKQIAAQALLLTDLWQNFYDGKSELGRLIALGQPLHDNGVLAALKIGEVHKNMVLKKFEKYILSYVLAGSLTQGRQTASSDIDVWIVIDDTDVKKMSRIELKEKLRSIIIGMGLDAADLTGIKNKLNIQVYILTNFWDSLKEANPIIFTLLRDGIPLYDRGIFMPWKQLLRMGKIKPSRESIDIFMSSGEQITKRVNRKLKEIGMEDLFYAVLTPTQAAIMMYGLAPPTPKETPEVLEEIFVKKEKLLEKKYVDILKRNVKLRKDLEHGSKKEVTGAELDKYLKDVESYQTRLKKLFEQIEERADQKSIMHFYDEIVTFCRDALRLEDVKKVADKDLLLVFESELVETGKVAARYLRDLKAVVAAKKKSEAGTLSKSDVEKTKKQAVGLVRYLLDYIQLRRSRDLERAKIRIQHGKKFGEITILGDLAFVVYDINAKERELVKAKVAVDGGLLKFEPTDYQEFEQALTSVVTPARVIMSSALFESIKEHFGKNAQVLLN